MIDEKKLIEDIINTPSKVMNEIPYEKTMFDNIHKRQNEILDVINKQPRVGEWTPVSEREPEEPEDGFKRYIVQRASNAEPRSLYWDQYGTWLDEEGTPYTDIIAWMPLPPAYKERNEE